jgi:anti-sigma regulatory factor (Ser/Thr protein kinase)
MPTASLTIPATPEQARTARLVAGAAARRAGVDEEAIDDIRLAVAEAVARAVTRAVGTRDGEVRLDLTDDADYFEISITDGQAIDLADEEGGLALSLISALAPRARVVASDPGQALVLTWPANQ